MHPSRGLALSKTGLSSVRRGSAVAVVCLTALSGLFAGTNPNIASELSVERFHVLDDQMRELIEALLVDNPGLVSAWNRSSSALQRVPQERSLPDPFLSYRYYALTPETRVGPQLHTFEISQSVPWGGKRKLQANRAASTAASRTWEAQDLERSAVAELKRAYFEAAYLQEALRINAEDRALLQRFESIALKRYATGQGIQQSVVKVQTEISRLEDRETELQARLDVLSRRLAELIGRPDQSLSLEAIELPFPDVEIRRDDLEQTAVTAHPRVNAVEQRVAADRVWAERMKLDSRPDFRVGLGYTIVGEREDTAGMLNPPEGNGDDILGLMVGINIPVHRKRIRAGVAEARGSERANEDLLRAVRDRLRRQVQQATVEVESLSERGQLYRDVIVPQAEESLASAEAAYTTNRLSFLDLLDAERVLFQSRLAYHRLLADLWMALADLEFAIASPFPSVPERSDRDDGAAATKERSP
jgi:outer membrane protein TolC